MAIVTYEEIDLTNPANVSVSATAIVLSQSRLGQGRRSSFSIVPLTAGLAVTVVKGEIEQCVADRGIVLTTNQFYNESDGDGYKCYQGTLCVVANGPGTIAFTETIPRS